VYPVPASSSVNIQNLPPGSVFKIFNAIGKEMYSGVATTEQSTIELSKYINGIYFIVAEVNGERYTRKFSVEK
ncbi:MAG TPA: T9SS type A sorting domain-containing protein, partial [Bacteroidia bacterium]|nr:T9SS type A sorting domain-containing protein [Bacteroidia bacterium]